MDANHIYWINIYLLGFDYKGKTRFIYIRTCLWCLKHENSSQHHQNMRFLSTTVWHKINCFLQILFSLTPHSFPIKWYNVSLVAQNCLLFALFCICHYLSSMRESKLIYSSWLKNARKKLKRMWFSRETHSYGGSYNCQTDLFPSFLFIFPSPRLNYSWITAGAIAQPCMQTLWATPGSITHTDPPYCGCDCYMQHIKIPPPWSISMANSMGHSGLDWYVHTTRGKDIQLENSWDFSVPAMKKGMRNP